MRVEQDYTAYWRAILARHRAIIKAGAISPYGQAPRRVVLERKVEELLMDTEEEQDDA
jgi:hypothetical protein